MGRDHRDREVGEITSAFGARRITASQRYA